MNKHENICEILAEDNLNFAEGKVELTVVQLDQLEEKLKWSKNTIEELQENKPAASENSILKKVVEYSDHEESGRLATISKEDLPKVRSEVKYAYLELFPVSLYRVPGVWIQKDKSVTFNSEAFEKIFGQSL